MINTDGLQILLDHYIYAILTVHGRQTTFEEMQSILIDAGIIVNDPQLLQAAYDFTCSLIDGQLPTVIN